MKSKLPYFMTEPWIMVSLILLGCIASMPADAPFLNFFAEFVQFQSLLFPPVAAYAQKSDFPKVMGLYMAFSFALTPAHFWYALSHLRKDEEESWHKNLWLIDSWAVFVQRLVLAMIGIAVAWIGLFFNPGYDFNLLPINTSATALALGGWILGGAGSAICLAWVVATLIALFRFLEGRIK